MGFRYAMRRNDRTYPGTLLVNTLATLAAPSASTVALAVNTGPGLSPTNRNTLFGFFSLTQKV